MWTNDFLAKNQINRLFLLIFRISYDAYYGIIVPALENGFTAAIGKLGISQEVRWCHVAFKVFIERLKYLKYVS